MVEIAQAGEPIPAGHKRARGTHRHSHTRTDTRTRSGSGVRHQNALVGPLDNIPQERYNTMSHSWNVNINCLYGRSGKLIML